MKSLLRASVPALLLVAGCAGRVTAHPGALPERSLAPLETDALPEDIQTTVGFDPAVSVDEEDWLQPGDQVLYRIHLHNGSRDREWFLLMELESLNGKWGTISFRPKGGEKERYRTEFLPLKVDVIEMDTGDRHQTRLFMPESSMRHSLFRTSTWYAAVEDTVNPLEGLTESERRAYVLGTSTVLTLFSAWQEDDELAGILKEVVGVPVRAMMGALFGGGLSYSIKQKPEADSATQVTLPAPLGALDAERLLLEIEMGGSTLMHIELLAVETAAPLNVGAGVVRLRGAHPTDEDRWVEVEIVGARRAVD